MKPCATYSRNLLNVERDIDARNDPMDDIVAFLLLMCVHSTKQSFHIDTHVTNDPEFESVSQRHLYQPFDR